MEERWKIGRAGRRRVIESEGKSKGGLDEKVREQTGRQIDVRARE